jgi:glycosyltransferase involved in cell wall biosynthesis
LDSNQQKKLRIAFLSVNDPLDRRSWSGTTYYIGQTLKNRVGDVHFLGPVKIPRWLDKVLRAIAKSNRILFRREYAVKYSLLLSWYTSRQLKKRMKGREYDCIVAPAASTELSYFRTRLPVIYISDTTFLLISNYYAREFRDLLPFSRWEGNQLEKRSLRKSSLIIYSSQWAARSAVADYGVPEDKLLVMPLGANMDNVPERAVIFEKEKNETLTLLYLAVEWERKGGPIVFDAFRYLRDSGVPVRLIVCGCIPPADFSDPGMEVIPFLNKNETEDRRRFDGVLSSAHFLVLPTRADCSLLVACEANAFGMPAITTDTGGVADVVLDGINGFCLPYEAEGKEYGVLIRDLFADREGYRRLVLSSRQRFEDRLNWDKWAEGFKTAYRERIGLAGEP